MTKHSTLFTLVAVLCGLILPSAQAALPKNWWLNSRVPSITSLDQLSTMIQGESKAKHVFIDFYFK
jgi:hypothetical protein